MRQLSQAHQCVVLPYICCFINNTFYMVGQHMVTNTFLRTKLAYLLPQMARATHQGNTLATHHGRRR
jgi:hypothetical protein